MSSIFKLKRLLTESSNLNEVLHYFLRMTETNNIIPDSNPLDEQEIIKNDVLQMLLQVVEEMIGDFLKQAIQITHPMISSIENQHFYHGICIVPGISMPIPLFYFSDIKKGFFALSGITQKTEMFRFSLAHLDKDRTPIMSSNHVAH